MARELFTTWGEYQAGIDRLLGMAGSEVRIYDKDLSLLKLDGGFRLEQINRLLRGNRPGTLHIALRDAEPFKHYQPRLLALYATHAHAMAVQQTPEHLAGLRDAMILVDGRHGLIRFDQEQPRAKLLTDEVEELLPYYRRFEEIWNEGGIPVSPTTLGL